MKIWITAVMAAVVALAVSGTVSAQTITPSTGEAKIDKKGRSGGLLIIQNDTLYKETITLDTKFIHKDADGKIAYDPVPDDFTLVLSDMSFVLQPKSKRTIYWAAQSDRKTYHLMLFTTFHTELKTANGMNIVVRMGASAYGCAEKKDQGHCREIVLISEGIDPSLSSKPTGIAASK
jgi:hypothetical protein